MLATRAPEHAQGERFWLSPFLSFVSRLILMSLAFGCVTSPSLFLDPRIQAAVVLSRTPPEPGQVPLAVHYYVDDVLIEWGDPAPVGDTSSDETDEDWEFALGG